MKDTNVTLILFGLPKLVSHLVNQHVLLLSMFIGNFLERERERERELFQFAWYNACGKEKNEMSNITRSGINTPTWWCYKSQL